MSDLTKAAQRYLASGLCVLPARRVEKRPAVGRWRQYQQRQPTQAELSAWVATAPTEVGAASEVEQEVAA